LDLVFVEGVAAVASAVLVFIGSVFLLLMLITGPRLAYFITASVTLGFVFIMTLVWSQGTPLGPVGQLPEWENVALAESNTAADFGAASSYPEGEWRQPATTEEDPQEATQAGELESAAIDYLEQVIEEGGSDVAFLNATDAAVTDESTRLLNQGDDLYGALQLEASTSALEDNEEADPEQIGTQVTPKDATAFVVMKYDPGNPLGKARTIAGGTLLLFLAHLFGLSRTERKVRQNYERPES
ncbi:MAG TPA: hypothetical protein VG408_08025, partial [Actinomycetota bacterium]|nr:hypothetical protein [Actinomycetota bacterium]